MKTLAVAFGVSAALVAVQIALSASVPAVEASRGMVVSSQHLASESGVEILARGGNAVDAAVAVGYAEAVTNPCCGNLGGGGFMLIHLAKTQRDVFVNFRETAPRAATKSMFLDAHGAPIANASLDGYRAVAVPGTVLGLDTALQRYGTLSRQTVMAPAIRLARGGFVLAQADADILQAATERLKRDPEVAATFLRSDGSPFQPGDLLRQPALARTLEAIASQGAPAFYRSEIAAELVHAMQTHGGIVTRQDLAEYTVTESAPVRCTYRGYDIASAPPPSSGGTSLCEMLNILEGYDLRSLGFHSAASVHVMVEAMRHAFVDRNTYLGDPAFVTNPLARLLSKDYAAQIRSIIDAERATPSGIVQALPLEEKPETTHYSVIDREGNAVAVTYTINGAFGAAVVAPGTGFLLNDEMDDFTTKPGAPNAFGLVQGAANVIAPRKRPLSSMSPTLVSRNGQIVLVLGSPGGSRIITTVLQVIVNVVDHGMLPQEAVDAPRIHHQWLPDEIFAEPFALSSDTVQILTDQGYRVTVQAPWGAAEVVAVPHANATEHTRSQVADSAIEASLRSGFIYGAHDARRPAGSAIGY
jgi:gamma-glutamyltranspeptidase/glutathione hydrolase